MSPTNVAGRHDNQRPGLHHWEVGPASITAVAPTVGIAATHPGNSVEPSKVYPLNTMAATPTNPTTGAQWRDRDSGTSASNAPMTNSHTRVGVMK